MTRSSLKRTLRRTYWLLGLVLALSFLAKVADHLPGIAGTSAEKLAKDVYEFMKDMALVFVTVIAAFLAGVFQKRNSFVASLHEEWRDILRAKSAIFAYTQIEKPTHEDWVKAFCVISETIDNMRVVYRNVGETDDLVGLYPYAPLHDMRRALQSINPRNVDGVSTVEQRKLVRDAMLQSFYALRENFLEELDLEEPSHPLLIMAGRRQKRSGAMRHARDLQDRQRREQDRVPPPSAEVDVLLQRLYEKETEKNPAAWPVNGSGAASRAEARGPA